MTNQLLFTILMGFALFYGVSPASAQIASPHLYGVTFFGNDLVAINEQTGESALVGHLEGPVSAYGIAARYGRLYAFSPGANEIVEINPATAKVNRSIPIGVHGLQGEGDLAFRGDGVGFLASALDANASPINDLYTFDVISGTSARIGSTGVTIDALAFDPHNVLYALGQGEGKLYTLNQTNGVATEVGSLGVDMNSPFAALTFSPEGELYASIDDRLYTLNKTTGAASPVSTNILDLGVSSASGLAYQVSEPGLQLYALSFFGNQLIAINPATGEGSLIGTSQRKIAGYGLATLGNQLFSFNSDADRLVRLDRANGNVAATLGSVPFDDSQGEGDLAFRSDGVGFLASALSTNGEPVNALYVFNIARNSTRFLTNTALTLDALAFDRNDILYALGQGEGKLFQVDQTTGALTEIGSLGVEMNSPFAAMTFGPDGALYAIIDDRLYTINPATGQASVVASDVLDVGFSSVSGLSFAPAPARLSIAREGRNAVLFWSVAGAILESSTNVDGPWKTQALQSEPQRIALTDQQAFFRLKQP